MQPELQYRGRASVFEHAGLFGNLHARMTERLRPHTDMLMTAALVVAVSGGLLIGGYLEDLINSGDESARRAAAMRSAPLTAAADDYRACVGKPQRFACGNEAKVLLEQVRAPKAGPFSLIIDEDWSVRLHNKLLIAFKNNCSQSTMADKLIAWSAWQAVTNKAFARYHAFQDDGRVVDETCVIAMVLPLQDIDRLSMSLVNQEKNRGFWHLSDARPTRPLK